MGWAWDSWVLGMVARNLLLQISAVTRLFGLSEPVGYGMRRRESVVVMRGFGESCRGGVKVELGALQWVDCLGICINIFFAG
jgi:hypothetical protein